MDRAINQLGQARIKHVLFKSKLRSYLYGSGKDRDLLLKPSKCTLGIWLKDFEENFGTHPELKELDKQHLRIHFKAQQLIALYDEGKTVEAQSGLDKIEEIAENLIKALDKLELKLKSAETHQ